MFPTDGALILNPLCAIYLYTGWRCPHFRGCYVQASIDLGPEDVSLLERCPHFRGYYVQASIDLGPEDVSLLERCPHWASWSDLVACALCIHTIIIRPTIAAMCMLMPLANISLSSYVYSVAHALAPTRPQCLAFH